MSQILSAQEQFSDADARSQFKPRIYLSWGWNRSTYSNSDLHFKGKDYDFTLDDVIAHDRQTPFGLDPYFHPGKITIPQTNMRLSYEYKPGWLISIGNDHMKYVMSNGQTVNISGYIDIPDDDYSGVYDADPIVLSPDFLTFEHTDGLNYINLGLRRRIELYETNRFVFSVFGGIGMGFLLPRTNTQLMSKERHDEFHLSGYGFDLNTGVQLMFWDHLFVQGELKGGFIHMPSIRTTNSKDDLAQQHFFFAQWNMVFGYRFSI